MTQRRSPQRMTRALVLAGALLLAQACDDGSGSPDAGSRDAEIADAAARDAQVGDAGRAGADGGAPDAGADGGAPDAGADGGAQPPSSCSDRPSDYGTTYYVRVDGGDATQCTGLADAPYPGSGTGQACAWNHPAVALPPSGAARIAGGDTLLIASGSYRMGGGGFMQPVPSGPDAGERTRVLGTSSASPPELWGAGGTHRVLNLEGSSNVEIGCLEVTDRSDCVFNHGDPDVECGASDDWARTGLYARASSGVWLHDLELHGLGARGVQAAGLTDWTLERVVIRTNGSAGWDGNVGDDAPNAGDIVLREVEIAWNGCGERWETGEPWACWAQVSGGYGDGMGTTTTGGRWLIEDAYVHHNTSDGLDLRYMDGADDTHVTVRRMHAVANAGNQLKIRGNSLVENSVLIGHCTYFEGRDFMEDGDQCRAYGSTILLVMTGDDVAVVRHNTIAGEGDAQIAYAEGGSSDQVFIQNNVVVGFPYYRSPTELTLFAGGNGAIVRALSGNLAWDVRSCPSGATCGESPALSGLSLASFDAAPLPTSPVIDAAPPIDEVVDDFLGRPRPVGAGPDIGAYEVQAP